MLEIELLSFLILFQWFSQVHLYLFDDLGGLSISQSPPISTMNSVFFLFGWKPVKFSTVSNITQHCLKQPAIIENSTGNLRKKFTYIHFTKLCYL